MKCRICDICHRPLREYNGEMVVKAKIRDRHWKRMDICYACGEDLRDSIRDKNKEAKE